MKELLETVVKDCGYAWRQGQVATYIPELAKARADATGIAVYDLSSGLSGAGDTDFTFTMQSVSKVVSLALALSECGEEKVFSSVGMDPLADPFNSIMRLEMDAPHRPHNPLINSGAIVVLSLLPWKKSSERIAAVSHMAARMTGRKAVAVAVNEAVYLSEKGTSDRNRALAWFLKSVGNLEGDIEDILDAYFRQCSLEVTCEDLAVLGGTLAADGRNPVTGERVVSPRVAQVVRTIMATCGMYDAAGDWMSTVGIPAKSGVSGAMLGVVPGALGLATWSPRLDSYGNSIRGVEVFRRLSDRWDLHVLRHREPLSR